MPLSAFGTTKERVENQNRDLMYNLMAMLKLFFISEVFLAMYSTKEIDPCRLWHLGDKPGMEESCKQAF
jgi:hypothetical protein